MQFYLAWKIANKFNKLQGFSWKEKWKDEKLKTREKCWSENFEKSTEMEFSISFFSEQQAQWHSSLQRSDYLCDVPDRWQISFASPETSLICLMWVQTVGFYVSAHKLLNIKSWNIKNSNFIEFTKTTVIIIFCRSQINPNFLKLRGFKTFNTQLCINKSLRHAPTVMCWYDNKFIFPHLLSFFHSSEELFCLLKLD